MKLRPTDLYNYLDKRVQGQDAVKRAISVKLCMHYLNYNLYLIDPLSAPRWHGNAMMILGPSGSGKTFITKHAVEGLRELVARQDVLGLVELDAMACTPPGWVGNSLSETLLESMKGMHDNAKGSAVIFIDEIDKWTSQVKGGEDYYKLAQYAILKYMEGHPILEEARSGRGIGQGVKTQNFFWILAGNFSQVRIERSLRNKESIGFHNLNTAKNPHVVQELETAGIVTQLLGRISCITETTKLTKDQLRAALTNPNVGLTMYYKTLSRIFKVDTDLTKSEIDAIIDIADKNTTGTRSLFYETEKMLQDKLFNQEFTL